MTLTISRLRVDIENFSAQDYVSIMIDTPLLATSYEAEALRLETGMEERKKMVMPGRFAILFFSLCIV
jgi:hypothetical protein